MNWMTGLDVRQRNEVALARYYATNLAHGTAGHNRLMLIAKMAGLLDSDTQAPPSRVVLNVPYHSQHEADAKHHRMDCGPACIEMVGEYLSPDTDVTTNAIMNWITGGSDRGTWIQELQDAAKHFYDVTLIRHDKATWADLYRYVAEGKSVIVLVHHGSFVTRMDRGHIKGHYLVVTGFDEVDYQGQVIRRIIVHDPDYYGVGLIAQGAFIPVTRDHFMKMWNDCYKDNNPKCMALVPNT